MGGGGGEGGRCDERVGKMGSFLFFLEVTEERERKGDVGGGGGVQVTCRRGTDTK